MNLMYIIIGIQPYELLDAQQLNILTATILHFGSINVDENAKQGQEKEALLLVQSLGHAALVFVNKKLVGW